MNASSVATITEFSIVLAGFSGLVIAIGSEKGSTNPLVKHRTILMLTLSFAAAFGSLLPLLAEAWQIQGIWIFSSYSLVPILLITLTIETLSSRFLLSSEERSQLKGYMYLLVYGGNLTFVLALTLSPSLGVFVTALIWQLIVSTIFYVRLILQA